ncbi:retrovirus-related pol polyprotein from transposon TNT 1-94 [Tanacetum coccineum]|uniref:Retrovirus-related pol polyprotein from transposon TNT 1-94 n=1 Tax=Tanacetum coccineum TaxID=301880 RepID=A0ABQ5JBW8_9ASTR
MCTYLKNMEGYKVKDLKSKGFDDIQVMFDIAFKRVNTFEDFRTELVEGKEKRAGEELIQVSSKKQKVDDDKETSELKQCLKIIPDEEEVKIDAIPLAVKSPSIVDWKIHKEGRKSYYQIMRADGKSQLYMIFSHMLKSFSREDLEDLYKLGDLKTMFEPHVEDTVWRNQQDYNILDWKLYDSCGVHSLRMQHMQIYMLVENKYPLVPSTLSMMLEKKLQIGYESEMAYQLLKFIVKQLKKYALEPDEWIKDIRFSINTMMGNRILSQLQGIQQMRVTQVYITSGIDYDETYAPVARLESIRILLDYACALYFKLFQMDVKSASLNGFIHEEVYMAQPLGFIDFEKPNHVYKLKKALYSLKQEPKACLPVSVPAKWSLDELAYGVPTDGPYQTNPPSPDDIILYIRIDREGQVRRIRHEEEIDVHEHQILTREIVPTLKPLEEIILENVLYDRVMNPLTAHQERKTRKDYGTRRGRHSTSSSSAFDQPSSSHLIDDYDVNGKGTLRASTHFPIRFVNSLTNDVP